MDGFDDFTIDPNNIPEIGLSGFSSTSAFLDVKDTVKELKKLRHRYCPIGNGIKTKLFEKDFIKKCLIHQETRISLGRLRPNKMRTAPGGFSGSELTVCATCKVGIKVILGEPFEPPDKISFYTEEEIQQILENYK